MGEFVIGKFFGPFSISNEVMRNMGSSYDKRYGLLFTSLENIYRFFKSGDNLLFGRKSTEAED